MPQDSCGIGARCSTLEATPTFVLGVRTLRNAYIINASPATLARYGHHLVFKPKTGHKVTAALQTYSP